MSSLPLENCLPTPAVWIMWIQAQQYILCTRKKAFNLLSCVNFYKISSSVSRRLWSVSILRVTHRTLTRVLTFSRTDINPFRSHTMDSRSRVGSRIHRSYQTSASRCRRFERCVIASRTSFVSYNVSTHPLNFPVTGHRVCLGFGRQHLYGCYLFFFDFFLLFLSPVSRSLSHEFIVRELCAWPRRGGEY